MIQTTVDELYETLREDTMSLNETVQVHMLQNNCVVLGNIIIIICVSIRHKVLYKCKKMHLLIGGSVWHSLLSGEQFVNILKFL